MSVTYLVDSDETNRVKGSAIFEGKETLSSPATGDDFILPDGVGKIDAWMIHLILSGTSPRAVVELSISNRSEIIAETAIWFEWDYGEVFVSTRQTFYQVSGIRMVNYVGTTVIEHKVI